MKQKKKNAHAGTLYVQASIGQQALAHYIGARQSTLSHYQQLPAYYPVRLA